MGVENCLTIMGTLCVEHNYHSHMFWLRNRPNVTGRKRTGEESHTTRCSLIKHQTGWRCPERKSSLLSVPTIFPCTNAEQPASAAQTLLLMFN